MNKFFRDSKFILAFLKKGKKREVGCLLKMVKASSVRVPWNPSGDPDKHVPGQGWVWAAESGQQQHTPWSVSIWHPFFLLSQTTHFFGQSRLWKYWEASYLSSVPPSRAPISVIITLQTEHLILCHDSLKPPFHQSAYPTCVCAFIHPTLCVLTMWQSLSSPHFSGESKSDIEQGLEEQQQKIYEIEMWTRSF